MPLYPYRIYCYNGLAKRGYDMTVVSVSNKVEKYNIPLLFEHKLSSFKKIGPFKKLNGFNIKDYENYDMVIVAPNLRVLDYYKFYNSHWWNKLLGWGHMTGRSSNNHLATILRYHYFKKFSALIFYEATTRDAYIAHGYKKEMLYVANNTQYVEPATVHPNEERWYYLYVGRIQKRKGIELAIKAFAKLKKQVEDKQLEFVIVGGGDNSSLKRISQEEGVEEYVNFVGPVHDQNKLGEWFSHAIAYVSPGHVGLGVLHSFACGVPVITCSGRLHSVEISNCKPENSLVVPYTAEEVFKAMNKLYFNKDIQLAMSKAALEYYNENCSIEKMVDGIDNALKYVSSNSCK